VGKGVKTTDGAGVLTNGLGRRVGFGIVWGMLMN
jgi:hypothetical protein